MNRIKFALYLKNWDYSTGNKKLLLDKAEKVLLSEYTPEIKGEIFCPECCVPLFRSPEKRDLTSNGRKAFYAHTSKHSPECSLRTKKSEGKKYESEEQARQAITDERLAIINSFMKEKPLISNSNSSEYQDNESDDQHTGLLEVSIGRHNGETFKLPSKVITVRGLCRNFDKNLNRDYLFPNQTTVFTLQDLLINVANVKEKCDIPKLYFGKIVHSKMGSQNPKHLRLTKLQYERNEDWVDFYLKAINENCLLHGINENSKGKVILMYGKITKSGVGLCLENIGWGELAVLPSKYENLLYE